MIGRLYKGDSKNRVFHYKPSILGYPYFWKHPYTFPFGAKRPIFSGFLLLVPAARVSHPSASIVVPRHCCKAKVKSLGGDLQKSMGGWRFKGGSMGGWRLQVVTSKDNWLNNFEGFEGYINFKDLELRTDSTYSKKKVDLECTLQSIYRWALALFTTHIPNEPTAPQKRLPDAKSLSLILSTTHDQLRPNKRRSGLAHSINAGLLDTWHQMKGNTNLPKQLALTSLYMDIDI